MYWRAAIVSMFLIGTSAAPAAHAVEITTYGAGLKTCSSYLAAREQGTQDVLTFIDWFGGYLSGANATSTHQKNVLGLLDTRAAMEWLDHYCRAHPPAHFAEAAGILLFKATSTIGAHSDEVTSYGTGSKPCTMYLDARKPRDIFAAVRTEFVDWIGGYLSGLNAISVSTNNVLGGSELTGALHWLDDYCSANPSARFESAVETLVAANRRGK